MSDIERSSGNLAFSGATRSIRAAFGAATAAIAARSIGTALVAAATALLTGGAALAQDSSAATAAPTIPYTSTPDLLKLPDDLYLGEVPGVATNSHGHIFVYTRTGNEVMIMGGSRDFVYGGSRLFEFDEKGTYLREIGHGIYGFLTAHVVRIDKDDNIWAVDEGAGMVLKFAPDGHLLMTLGRKPEAIPIPAAPRDKGPGLGVPGDTFNGPTDVGFDAHGNIFVADGSGNARVVKLDPNGVYIKSWGGRGTGPGQFSELHTLAVDAQGNVYVGDRNKANSRIQVFDNDGQFKAEIRGIGVPTAICISPGPHPYLFSSNSNGPSDYDNGEIYKMELDGRILGKFGKPGKRLGEFGSVHEIDCRDASAVFVGELANWRVQKLMLSAR